MAIKGLMAFTEEMLPAAAKGLEQGLQRIVGVSNRKYLSGPRPQRLDVLTGRLRGSITYAVDVSPDVVRGSVGTNLPYGEYHERGFHGTEQVRSFTRATNIKGFQKINLARSRKDGSLKATSVLYKFDNKGKIIGYKRTLKEVAAKLGLLHQTTFEVVKAHTRKVDYAGKPFLAPAIEESKTVVAELINDAVKKAQAKL